MVKKICQWLIRHEDRIIIGALCSLIFMIGGCHGERRARAEQAKPVPAVVERYEVPFGDTSASPDLICLMPGQSAMLLEDVVVAARIPYNGRELFVGAVKLEKGTMLVKPKVE